MAILTAQLLVGDHPRRTDDPRGRTPDLAADHRTRNPHPGGGHYVLRDRGPGPVSGLGNHVDGILPPLDSAIAGDDRSASVGPLEPLRNLIPDDAVSIVARELRRLQDQPSSGVISVGLVAILWFSTSLFVAIMDAMNRIMGVEETRPIWKQRFVALLMTLSQAAILIVALATILIWPQIIDWLGLSHSTAILATVLHGLAVFLLILLSFAVALYFGPDADQRWEWITPGSLLGTPVVLLVSYLFRVYVQNWGNYTATYGSLGGIVVLMSWFWLCSVVLLAAAVLNHVIKDASPLGRRSGKNRESTMIGTS